MPTPDTVYRWLWRFVICAIAGLALGTAAALLPGCAGARPQQGGRTATLLGGAGAATTVTTFAPENPQTPSTTTIEKTTLREWAPPLAARVESPELRAESQIPQPSTLNPQRGPALLREQVTERSSTITGAAQKDTARELGAKLAAMQPVMWVGALLVPIGIGVGWLVAKRGWLINGVILGLAIAGSGAAMVAIAVWLPGINPLCGLLLLGLVFAAGLVWAVYYKSQHDALAEGKTLKAES
jgi:hypothetical protein